MTKSAQEKKRVVMVGEEQSVPEKTASFFCEKTGESYVIGYSELFQIGL